MLKATLISIFLMNGQLVAIPVQENLDATACLEVVEYTLLNTQTVTVNLPNGNKVNVPSGTLNCILDLDSVVAAGDPV